MEKCSIWDFLDCRVRFGLLLTAEQAEATVRFCVCVIEDERHLMSLQSLRGSRIRASVSHLPFVGVGPQPSRTLSSNR